MFVYGVSLVSEILNRPDLLIDVTIVVIFGIIHTLAWKEIKPGHASGEAKGAGTAIRGAAAAGITVVGILVPLSILAIQLRSNPQARPLANDVLVSLFVADVWLLLSLGCGVYVLWIAAMRAYKTENVLGDKSVGIVIGFQLVLLFSARGPRGPSGAIRPTARKSRSHRWRSTESLVPRRARLDPPTIKKGAEGNAVKLLQHILGHFGFGVDVDSDFGPATEGAVRDFQVWWGLDNDGIVGPLTWTALNS